MDLQSILVELRAAQEEFKQSERSLATAIFCQRVDKALDRIVAAADRSDFEHLVVGILVVIGSFNDLLPQLLDGPLLTQLLDRLFRQCARVVLDIKWQQCDKDTPSQQSFRTSLLTCHQLMAPRGYRRFSVLQTLMDNPWTHPVLSMVMGNEEDNEEGEGLAYIQAQDPEILKLRVELMQQENCDEFALNLCTWCLKHPGLAQDFVLRKTQFVLLHRLNNIDRLQEECQKMGMEDSLRLIRSLLGREEHKELCTMLAQTFLVQNWIKPSDNHTKKELLQLWIRLQYQADQDQERFITSLWAVAKLSHSTQQLLLIIDAVREQCGDTFLQFCLDLCKFAINVDKGCWEKLKEDNASGPKEELVARKQDMAQVCEKISHIVAHVSPKVSFCCALTAFSMMPTEQSLQAMRIAHQRRLQVDESGRSQCCSNCATDKGQCLKNSGSDKSNRDVNVATLYEVERLCGTLRPSYLSSESDFSVLYSMCKQYLLKENGEAVQSALVRRRSASSVQHSPIGSVPADSSLPNLGVSDGSLTGGSTLSATPMSAPVSRMAFFDSHVSNLMSPQRRDPNYKQGLQDRGLTPSVSQKSVVQLSPMQNESSAVTISTSKPEVSEGGQTEYSNPVQQLVLKQLSTDTVQVLLHLIESGQISASLVNNMLTKNPGVSLQALNDLISKAKENAAAQKLGTPQSSQQPGPQQQVQHQQMHKQQGHLQQQLGHLPQQNKLQAQPGHPRELVDKHFAQSLHTNKMSHPRFEGPQAAQSGSLQPARMMLQGAAGLQQQTPQPSVVAPQQLARPRVGTSRVSDSQLSASTQFLSHQQDPGKPPASTQQQVVQGLPHIGSVTLPAALHLTGTRGIQVTQPVHVMTIRQPVSVQSAGNTVHNAQIVMQSSTHMLTHLSGGSVVAAAQQQPHILHLPSTSVSFAPQHSSKAASKSKKLIPKAPGLSTLSNPVPTSSGSSSSSGDLALGNRHYSINNLLFTGEQQNSALSISLPDRLPEISVDSISDTLRALSDSSGPGGQAVPRVSMQLAQNPVSQAAVSGQRPRVTLQPSPRQLAPKPPKQQQARSKKAVSPKASAAKVAVSSPPTPTPSSQCTQALATLASFAVSAAHVGASEQTLPSFSSLFSSSRSPLPLPKASTETVTTSTITAPLPTTTTTTTTTTALHKAPASKKGAGPNKGQKKGANKDTGAKKDKKGAMSSKEEMMRLLKQAMSLNMDKKEQDDGGAMTGLHPPGQDIPPHLVISTPGSTSAAVSSASVWMVDFPSHPPPVSREGHRLQQSSQPGLPSYSTAALPHQAPSTGVSRLSASLTHHDPAALSTRTTTLSSVMASAPPLPSVGSSASLEVQRAATAFMMPEHRDSKLFHMLQKGDGRQAVSSPPAFSREKHVAYSVASYPDSVHRQQLGNSLDTMGAERRTVPNIDSSVHESALRSVLTSSTETVAASGSTKPPPLPYSSEFAGGSSQKDPAAFYPSEHQTSRFASWNNPAASYSTIQAARRSSVADMSSTSAVPWPGSPAVAPAVGNPTVASAHQFPASPAIPSVVYEDSSYLPTAASSTAQSMSAAQNLGACSVGAMVSGDGDLPPSQSVQQNLADLASSLPTTLVSTLPEGSFVEANRPGNKPYATYRCLICSKAFSTLDALKIHVKRNCKPDEPESQPNADGSSSKAAPTLGGLETSTVFQCMRCFELCISEAGIRAHKQVCRNAPKPRPKAKAKSKAKPKQPKSEEEQATEARVMELLNKCLGENREKLQQENKAAKAKKGTKKKSPSKRKTSTDTQLGQSSSSKKPKKEKSPAQSTSDMPSLSGLNLPVPAILQHNQQPPMGAVDLRPAVDGVHANQPPPQPTTGFVPTGGMLPTGGIVPTVGVIPSGGVAPAVGVVPTGDSQPKVEKPKPKRKYYPKKKKPAADVLAGSNSSSGQKKETAGEPGTTSKSSKSQKPSSSKQPKPDKPETSKPKKPHKEGPPRPRFKQVSGSGGRSFFKCLNCGQTLCSIENFNDHWGECINKKPLPVTHKRSSKEKKPRTHSSSSSKAHSSATYSSQASIDAIIQSVASGSYTSGMPDHELLMNFSENLAGNPDTASYLEVSSAASPPKEDSEADKLKSTSSSQLPADTLELATNQLSEQSDSGIFEGYRSQASVGNEGEDRVRETQNVVSVSSFFAVVSESSGLLHGQTDSAFASYSARPASVAGSYTLPPGYGLASQPEAAIPVESESSTARTAHAQLTSVVPLETTPFISVPLSQTALSSALSTQPPISDALSSQTTVASVMSSSMTVLQQLVSSVSASLGTQSMQQDIGWEVLTSQSEAGDELSLPKMQSDTTVTPHTPQAAILSSTDLDSHPQKNLHESSAPQPIQSESVPSLKVHQSYDASKTASVDSLVSVTAQSDTFSLTRTGIDVDAGTASGQMESETSSKETNQSSSGQSTPAKPETKSRSRSQKKAGGAQERRQSASKPSQKSAKKQRSNSTPKPPSKGTENSTPTDTDTEISGDITTPKPAVSSDGKSGQQVSPKKPSGAPPQDIKEVTYCKLCDRYYSRHWALVRHFAGQHVRAVIQEKEDGTLHFCPFCDGVFSQKHLFRTHVMIHPDMLLRLFLDEESLALGTNKSPKQASSRRSDAQKVNMGSEPTLKKTAPVVEGASAEEVQLIREEGQQSVETTAEKSGHHPSLETGLEPKEGTPKVTVEENPASSPVATSVKNAARKQKSKQVKPVDSKRHSSQDRKGNSNINSMESGKSPAQSDKTKAAPLKLQAHKNDKKDKLHPLQILEIVQLGKFCRICKHHFDRNWALMQHIIRHHVHMYTTKGEGLKMTYCCDICKEEFTNKNKYMTHSSKHYRIIVQEFNKIEVPVTVENSNLGKTEVDAGSVDEKAMVREPVVGKEASAPHGDIIQEGESNKETSSKNVAFFPTVQMASSIEADTVDTSEKAQSCVEPMSTGEQNDKSTVSPELMITDEQNDDGKMSAETNCSKQKGREDSHPSSSKRSMTRKLAALLKKTDGEDSCVSDGKSEDRTETGDQTIENEACGNKTTSVEVSDLNSDHSNHVGSISTTLTKADKIISSDSGVSVSDGTLNESNSDTVLKLSESDKNHEESSATSVLKSDSTVDDSQLTKKTPKRLQRKLRKRKDVLKSKSGGVQKRGKSLRKQKIASPPKINYCRICRRSFCRNWVLAQHITSQHLHPYTMNQTETGAHYMCHLCQAVFTPKAKYMIHVVSHARVIIEQFNKTDSLTEVKFGGRTYRITADASEVDPAKLANASSANSNKAKKDGHKKRVSIPTRTSTKSPKTAAVKNASSSSRNRRKSSRVSMSQSNNSVSSDSTRVQSSTEPPRESGKRRSTEPVSSERKCKRARTERPSKVKPKNKGKKPEKIPANSKENTTSGCSPGQNDPKSDQAGSKREEEVREEADAASSESKPNQTQSEKANSDSGEYCSEETSTKNDQSSTDTEPKQSEAETSEANQEATGEDGENKKPDEGKDTSTESVDSVDSESKHATEVVDSESKHAKEAYPETDIKENKCEQKTEEPFVEAVPACADSKPMVTGTEKSTSHQNSFNKEGNTKSESAEESVSATEEGSLAKSGNADGSGQSVMWRGKVKNMRTSPVPSLSSEHHSPRITQPEKPSFLDSFKNFVSTRTPTTSLPVQPSRRRFFSGNTGTSSESCGEKAAKAKRVSNEWPAQNPALLTPPASSAAKVPGAAKASSISSGQGVLEPTTVVTRTRRRSLEHTSLNKRKSSEQFSAECNNGQPCDRLPSEGGSCGDRDASKSSEAAEIRKEQCSSTSGLDGKMASFSDSVPNCTEDSMNTSDSVPNCSEDSVKMSESVPKDVRNLQVSEAVPGTDRSDDTVKAVHSTNDALASASPLVSEGSSELSQQDVHRTNEKKEELSVVSTASKGEQQEMATIAHSMTSDNVQSPHASSDSVEQMTNTEKTSCSLPSEKAGPSSDGKDASAERIPIPEFSTASLLPQDATLTGILHKAIDMAYQQASAPPVSTSSSILPSLFTASESNSSDSTGVKEQPEKLLGRTVSSDGVSDSKESPSHADNSVESSLESASLDQDPKPTAEDILVDTSPSSCLQPQQSVKESCVVGGGVPSTENQLVTDTPEISTSVSSAETLSIPEVQQSLTTHILEHTLSSDSVERMEEKDDGKDSASVVAMNTKPEESISDRSDFSHAAEEQCPESKSGSLQESVIPISAPELSETATENQVRSLEDAERSGISEGAVVKSDDTVEDAEDTSNDMVKVLVLSDPQTEDKCPSPVEPEDNKSVLEKQDRVSDHTEAAKVLENGEQKTELENSEQKTELCASSEEDVEESFELEDDCGETIAHSAMSDPSSVRDVASVPSVEITRSSAESVRAHSTQSTDETNSAKEDSDLELSTQSTSGADVEKKEPLQETVVASSLGTATTTSHNTSIRCKQMSYDMDTDTDLPDLCIETDPKSRIFPTKLKPADSKKTESPSSSLSDKAFRKDMRFGSSEGNLAPEKRNVAHNAAQNNSDVVVSTVVGEYEVTVKKLLTNKSPKPAFKPTYCTTVEVKTEQVGEDVKEVVEADPAESPVRKPMLGVKPLRSVLQPEPFVWDAEAEEDRRRRARNERSLKAFQQQVKQVNDAPFIWEADGAGEGKNQVGKKGSSSQKAAGTKDTDSKEEGEVADSLMMVGEDCSNSENSSGKQASSSRVVKDSSCVENDHGDHNQSGLANTEEADLQNGDNKDSDSLQSNVDNLNSACTDEVDTKNNTIEKSEGNVRSENVPTRRNKTVLSKPDNKELDRDTSAASAAMNHSEGGSDNYPQKMTRARASLTRQLTTRSRTLRSESSESVRKRLRVSSSRERKNESALKRSFRKSRSFDLNSDHSAGMDSEVSSTRSELPGSENAINVQPTMTSNFTISTRSRPHKEKSKLYARGQKFAQHKYSSKFESQVKNRTGLRSGLDKNSRKKPDRKPNSAKSGLSNSHENSQQMSEQPLPNSSLSSNSKPQLRDRSSDKTERERSSERDRSVDKTDSHQPTKPSSKQNSSSKVAQPESGGLAANCGFEAKVLRSRDITPDKGTASHQESVSQQSSDSESLRGARTRHRRTSSNSSHSRVASEEGKGEGANSKPLSGVDRKAKDVAHKPSSPQPNLSAMVRRRQQHPAHWHKAAAKPAKKRPPLSSQAPQYEIIRVEPVKEDSAPEHRRTRSSDREVEPSSRTVHTRVSVDAVKPGLHNSSPKKTLCDQKWSMKRHLAPADIRKRSADPHFPFTFKRAKRKTDSK